MRLKDEPVVVQVFEINFTTGNVVDGRKELVNFVYIFITIHTQKSTQPRLIAVVHAGRVLCYVFSIANKRSMVNSDRFTCSRIISHRTFLKSDSLSSIIIARKGVWRDRPKTGNKALWNTKNSHRMKCTLWILKKEVPVILLCMNGWQMESITREKMWRVFQRIMHRA